jgi:hypothetical protein
LSVIKKYKFFLNSLDLNLLTNKEIEKIKTIKKFICIIFLIGVSLTSDGGMVSIIKDIPSSA